MPLRSTLFLASVAAAFVLSPYAYAQPGPTEIGPSVSPIQFWVDGGLGYGGGGAGPNTEAGGHLSGRLAARVSVRRMAITARTTATTGGPSDYSTSPFFVGPGVVHDGFYDAGVLVGYALPLGGAWEATGSTGLAVVWGTRAVSSGCFGFCFGGSGRSESFAPRPGLPLELDLTARVRDGLRLGLLGYANVNAEETFGGVLLSASVRL